MKRLFTFIMALFIITAFSGGTALATQPGDDGEHKVGLCHRTASDTNPYVFIEVDEASLSPGHLDNDDPGHKPKTWKSDGVFRGVAHVEGDPKDDYLATDASECEDNTTPQPEDKVTVVDDTRLSCEKGLEAKTYTTTTPYIWVDGEWVLDIDNAVTTSGDWFFVRDLTDKERRELKCDTDIVTNVKQVRLTCDGFFVRNVEITTDSDGNVTKDPSKWFKLRDATKAEKAELECNVPTDKPEPKPDPKGDKDPEPNMPAPPQDTLPHTGGEAWLVVLATALLAAGGSLILGSRKLTGN